MKNPFHLHPLRRKEDRKPTIVDVIDYLTWNALDPDEQRLIYVIERRQLGRTTVEQFLQDLADWRRSYALMIDIRRTSR